MMTKKGVALQLAVFTCALYLFCACIAAPVQGLINTHRKGTKPGPSTAQQENESFPLVPVGRSVTGAALIDPIARCGCHSPLAVAALKIGPTKYNSKQK